MSTRRELVDAIGARYRLGSRSERSSIMDEFVAITGYHRILHPLALQSPGAADGAQSLLRIWARRA